MSTRAVILAGGRGSRLRPFTTVIPKPLVPVGDMPILEVLIRRLVCQGFDRLTLSVGYLAPLIESYCGDGRRWGVRLDYLREDQPLGTAGMLGLLDLTDDRVLVTNGDILTDLNLGDAYRSHDPALGATICASRRTVQMDFGVLRTDADGFLSSYEEKPTLSYRVSMGINVLSSWAVRRYVEPGVHLDMPDLMCRLLGRGHRVRVRTTDAYWLDMGRMADLEVATEVFTREPERFLV
jgi:NDP-sugar pyrophosphorylase family protein